MKKIVKAGIVLIAVAIVVYAGFLTINVNMPLYSLQKEYVANSGYTAEEIDMLEATTNSNAVPNLYKVNSKDCCKMIFELQKNSKDGWKTVDSFTQEWNEPFQGYIGVYFSEDKVKIYSSVQETHMTENGESYVEVSNIDGSLRADKKMDIYTMTNEVSSVDETENEYMLAACGDGPFPAQNRYENYPEICEEEGQIYCVTVRFE